MVKSTQEKVDDVITQLHQGKHFDDMNERWLSQTPKPPRIPIFYTLTKIHKPKPVGIPIIFGCDGPTERISSFVDTLLQPIAQKQQSFIKDTTDFIETKIGKDTILVSMEVSSLYTNIPQEEGVNIVYEAYAKFHNHNPPIQTLFLRQMLGLILNENSFQFNGDNYLQTHGTAMGTKMAHWNIVNTTERKEYEKDILMISSPSGTATKIQWTILLNKLTNSTPQSNLRPKYQRTKSRSSTR